MDTFDFDKLEKIYTEEIGQITGGTKGKPSLPCRVCGEYFEGFTALAEHYKTEHPDVWAEWHKD